MEITLDNIYYDFDRWEIRKDAEPTLFALANNLRLNPAVRIELASHTDCRGDEDYNANLSYKRALSAVEFLIESGIDENRIEARGYGKSRPYIDCVCSKCTEEQHQANRRTTFRILE
jgi:outer membrane protein OmpA-like peptidoglycan-associated protein